MSEENAQPQGETEQTPVSPQAEASPTLEQLYEEFGVASQQQTPPAPQSTPEVQPQPTPAEQPPDTSDPEALYRWSVKQNAGIQQDVSALRNEIAAERQKVQRQAEERDFSNAVAHIAKEAGVPEDQRDMVEGFLLSKARNDERLTALWAARHDKPDAWKKALGVLSQQARGKFAVKVDPQIEENQRAMAESQKAQSTQEPPKSSPVEEVLGKSNAEFDNWWQRALGRR